MTNMTQFTESGFYIVDAEGDPRYCSPYSTREEATTDYFNLLRGGMAHSDLPLSIIQVEVKVAETDVTPSPGVTVGLDDLETLLAFHKGYATDTVAGRELRQRCHIAASYANTGRK
jgi:hypothetical protein